MSLNKAGYQYLKEKIAKQQEEITALNSTIDELRQYIQQMGEEIGQLKDSQEQEIFKRMVKSIKVGRGWK